MWCVRRLRSESALVTPASEITILPRYSLSSGTAAMLCCRVLWRLRISREACAGPMR